MRQKLPLQLERLVHHRQPAQAAAVAQPLLVVGQPPEEFVRRVVAAHLHLRQQLVELGVRAQGVAALLAGAARHHLPAVPQLAHALLGPRGQFPEGAAEH